MVLSLFKIDHSNLRIEKTGIRIICVVVRDEEEMFENEHSKELIGNHILRGAFSFLAGLLSADFNIFLIKSAERKAEEKAFGVPS